MVRTLPEAATQLPAAQLRLESKSNGRLVLGAIVALVIVAGGWYVLRSREKAASPRVCAAFRSERARHRRRLCLRPPMRVLRRRQPDIAGCPRQ